MKNFVSVSTNAARFQDISLNPQKLAGMCAKLKCCLNYEVDDYVEANKKLPSKEVILQTQDSDYYLFKTDILAGICTYSTDKNLAVNLEEITAKRAHEIIDMNKRGEKPLSLLEDGKEKEPKKPVDLLANADISRFDKSKKKKKKKQPKAPKTQDNANTSPVSHAQEGAKESNPTQAARQEGQVNRQKRGGQPNQNAPTGQRPGAITWSMTLMTILLLQDGRRMILSHLMSPEYRKLEYMEWT